MALKFSNGDNSVPVFKTVGGLFIIKTPDGKWRSYGTAWVHDQTPPFMVLQEVTNPQNSERDARAALETWISTGGANKS